MDPWALAGTLLGWIMVTITFVSLALLLFVVMYMIYSVMCDKESYRLRREYTPYARVEAAKRYQHLENKQELMDAFLDGASFGQSIRAQKGSEK